MLKSLRSKLTYANITATIALFLALSGGVAYAANTVFSTDIVDGEVRTADLHTGAVTAPNLASNSVNAAKVADFNLTNEDVGVLFAEVRGNATIANSSGAVTATRVGSVGQGNYAVRFSHAVNNCTAVATIGPFDTTHSTGQVNVADQVGDVNAVFVDTNDIAGTAADRPFRLVVVC